MIQNTSCLSLIQQQILVKDLVQLCKVHYHSITSVVLVLYKISALLFISSYHTACIRYLRLCLIYMLCHLLEK
jgi:hypothetical protein